ncbi:MAG: Gldg family protein, partial [Anaerolineae bacterium]|nr:Gldg family protein [Anaerolineae bacterium]
MRQTIAIARKELDGYFSSLMALIFVGVFLAVTLFTFFWVADFWARELTDVRPLFRWMPLLMIFLAAALTMRQWSEEQQTGTLEVLLTMPVHLIQLVLGKFLAVLGLVIVALALTFFLPITISTLGDLDWGPVIGGYLAAILMAAAYIAIGLFISSRTDNQIVALSVTVLLAGALHLIGTASVTDLFNSDTGELLRNLSTSGRFQSIERGVIDLHDLLYYISLTGCFLGLNVLSLVMRRWGRGEQTRNLRFNNGLTAALSILNIVALNMVLYPVNIGRFDLTEDKLYTLSLATEELLSNLQEPLLIRGYFSENNHPLLEPLIPQIEDMFEEYDVAANDKLTVEHLDPIDDPDLEAEANQTYGISPIALQVSDRSGQSILNVYFHILVRYGDQSEVLTFEDLIAIDQFGNDIEVRLRNLEYDLTSTIKRVVEGFQSVDSVLAALDAPAQLTLYYTPETLPESLADVPTTIETVANDIQA